MRHLGSVVFILSGSVHHPRKDLSMRCGIASKFVRDKLPRRFSLSLQAFEKEPFGSSLVPTLGHQDVENITVLINSSPQVDLPSVDLQEQLIHVPDVAQSASLLSD